MQHKVDWLQSRKKMLKQVKLQVQAFLEQDPEVDSYARSYQGEFKGQWQVSDQSLLKEKLLKSQLVLGGDFHAFSQAQRAHLRILRSLPNNCALVLALECIESRYQSQLQKYMKGDISEEGFLEAVCWDNHWGFEWKNYKPLFDFAQKRKIPVFGINKYFRQRNFSTLNQRDIHSARQILKIKKNHPNSINYCLYGDLHLASNHLPGHLSELGNLDQKNILRIFLNSEKLYFQLAKKSLENKVDVLKGPNNRFCILSSPPWIKWQSYLMYLEQAYDHGLFDEDDEDEIIDYTDQVAHWVSFVAKDLSLNIKLDELAVSTYGMENELVQELTDLQGEQQRMVNYLFSAERSFLLPENETLFLARPSINHCASLAGYYIHGQLCGLKKSLWSEENFYSLIWHEAVAFFLSKFINHKRKSDKMQTIKTQLKVMDPRNRGRDPLLLVLNQRMDEILYVHSNRRKKKEFSAKHAESYVIAAKILGSMLGERVYRAHQNQRVDTKKIIGLMSLPLEGDFSETYYQIVKQFEATEKLIPRGRQL